MKKLSYLFPVLIIGIIMVFASCEEDEKETCKQDEICEAKSVTACCTGDVCVYKFNGKEYAEDELTQLTIDLGCGTASASLKSDDNVQIINRLKSLMQEVKASSSCCN